MPPRRRTSTPRRPRVAGLTPTAQRAGTDTEDRDHPAATRPPRRGARPAAPARAEETPVGGRRGSRRSAGEPVPAGRAAAPPPCRCRCSPSRWCSSPAWPGSSPWPLRRCVSTPSAANTALVDVGATAEAAGQLSDAVETVYSFDFARLDENERAAREVITPAFATEFEQLFARSGSWHRRMQAVVTGDRHAVGRAADRRRPRRGLVFVDQQATRRGRRPRAARLGRPPDRHRRARRRPLEDRRRPRPLTRESGYSVARVVGFRRASRGSGRESGDRRASRAGRRRRGVSWSQFHRRPQVCAHRQHDDGRRTKAPQQRAARAGGRGLPGARAAARPRPVRPAPGRSSSPRSSRWVCRTNATRRQPRGGAGNGPIRQGLGGHGDRREVPGRRPPRWSPSTAASPCPS